MIISPVSLTRNSVSRASLHPWLIQKRWAQVHDIRIRLLGTQRNQIFEKYKAKLDIKAKEHGLQDTQELRELYREKIEKLRTESVPQVHLPSSSSTPFPMTKIPPEISSSSQPLQSLSSSRSHLSSSSGVKSLSAYLDVEKTSALPIKDIETIWRLRNLKNAHSLCAMIPLPLYREMERMAQKYPSFILPLPREDQGAEIHYLQWTFPAENVVTVLITHLAEYKLRGEYSQPHTTITHHLELAEKKEIVLLRGEVIEGKGVTVDEAKWLLLCLQRFYGGLGQENEKSKRREMIEMFGRGDVNFRIEDLLHEAEKIV
ncbi:Protein ATP11, mitochondrial [Golovinomyces cichoracearum]|uniref:Protein ATP11, mitochondrial n=1 Tax=Golovinomyces cichoracearum TaxID=62708 RepID=A0A420J6N5_9PEZI|nr:Protein ATP11, mitochondrial [Golovinomyces cichoracearum]